jgi:hypothetical protein
MKNRVKQLLIVLGIFSIAALIILSTRIFFTGKSIGGNSYQVMAGRSIYADLNLNSNCTNENYSIVNRDCSGSDGNAYKDIQSAVSNVTAGDTIYVRGGIYRESIIFETGGSEGKVITLMNYPNEEVIIDGSEVVEGWTQCLDCGNSNIYYSTIDWNTSALFEDEAWLTNAREPDFGYFNGISSSSGINEPFDYIEAEKDLNESAEYYIGANVEIEPTADRGGLGWYYDKLRVSGFSNGRLALNKTGLSGWAPWDSLEGIGINPWFYLHNKREYISHPGEWTIDYSVYPYKIYLWPLKGGDPNDYNIEASKRDGGVGISTWPNNLNYITFDGIDVKKINLYPYTGWTGGIGYYLGGGSYVSVMNANITYNAGTGVYSDFPNGNQIINNTISYNFAGIGNGGHGNGSTFKVISRNMTLIEGNHIHHNLADGVTIYYLGNFTIRNNEIDHHNSDMTHTDNFQTWLVKDIILDGNKIYDGGQDVIMQDSENTIFTNNIVYYSAAYSFVFNSDQPNLYFVNNSVLFPRWGPFNLANRNTEYKNNVFHNGGASFGLNNIFGNINDSDYNYFASGISSIGYGGHYYTKDSWQDSIGMDKHSIFGGEEFKNMPLDLIPVDSFCARDTLCPIETGSTEFEVGGIVEYSNDGVARTITSVNADNITIDPPLDYDKIGSYSGRYFIYWGNNSNVTEDFRPLGGQSICIGSDANKVIGTLPCYGCESNSPISLFNINITNGYTPLRVLFNGSYSDSCSGSIDKYSWDFGDGATGEGSEISHTFSAGSYDINLTVTNNLGLNDSFIKNIFALPTYVPGLKMHLTFDNSVYDFSGNKNYGTWQGNTNYGSGKFGEAAMFDGTSNGSFVVVGDSSMLRAMNELTIAFWAKKINNVNGGTALLKHIHYGVNIGSTSFGFYAYNGSVIAVSGTDSNDMQWHHYALTYNSSVIRAYIDGNLTEQKNMTGRIYNDSSRDIYIGKDPWGNSFNGSIDDFRIYNIGLSQEEIFGLYNMSNDSHCYNGISDFDEGDIDCNGSCAPCIEIVPTCHDDLKNQDETGVDCGGSCNACLVVDSGDEDNGGNHPGGGGSGGTTLVKNSTNSTLNGNNPAISQETNVGIGQNENENNKVDNATDNVNTNENVKLILIIAGIALAIGAIWFGVYKIIFIKKR